MFRKGAVKRVVGGAIATVVLAIVMLWNAWAQAVVDGLNSMTYVH